ncbi:flagellar basal body L-ring protein FlgH [Saccharophagus sp. K07]|jgi:flagellar L-ring protein precursor FlgH|uniref:flagellar basal body L-ring protein FlgH n=1 Tax=Saccharophagus sp. K07 TaxID=2283636 RepID=UPI0016522009|nr:flagellar basal body L-ring protein FlgH [Saccharophagus sp. K07]MBC6907404.1 flagellar basal body L-ring protein FlgH [Saccharophagus sp. K07]
MKISLSFWLCCLVLGLAGCVAGPSPQPNDPFYAPVMTPSPDSAPASNGSLYQASRQMNLFEDRKAGRLGDILTVVLTEKTVSKKSSNVEITKESDVSIPGANASVLGNPVHFKGLGLNTNLSSDREFSGEAGAAQSNNLIGDVAVSVVDVWPNGTLVVRGEKWLTLNQGDEVIRISGLVRPEDVRPDNTVLSTKVANARITYTGTGTLADSQSPGWLSRFFNSAYWPF